MQGAQNIEKIVGLLLP